MDRMLLSIDVGIRNLAMCGIDDQTCEIKHWDVDGVPPQHEDGLFLSLRKHLDARPWLLCSKIVLIEKQPGKNKKMTSVQHFLHAYFLIKCPDAEVIIYDAKHKVTDCVGAGKDMYKKRKNAAVDRCLEFLNEDDAVNRHWLPMFQDSKKKDDLADTVLQALSFIRRIEPRKSLASSTPREKKKLVPRRPNENQKNTKYSKCNLAWIYLNDHERVKLKRFEKDLKRYFKSMDELERAMGVKSLAIE